MSTTKGKVYYQTQQFPNFDFDLPTGNVCIFPEEHELDPLLQYLNSKEIKNVVSIGCGEGWLEGLLQKKGLKVVAVDLDYLRDPEEYRRSRCYCDEIVRINAYQLYRIQSPEDTALLFCFGRKTVHFARYIEHYSRCPVVVIIGDKADSGVTSPSTNELSGNHEWVLVSCTKVRGVMPAEMAIYERISKSDKA